MRLARVPSSEAAERIPQMMRSGMVDRHAKISKDGCYRLVPLLEGKDADAESMGFEVVDGTAHSRYRVPPQQRIAEALSDLPEDVRSRLPMKWEHVGSILIIRLDRSADPYLERIGKVYASEVGASTVCVDRGGVSGEYRRPEMEVIFGTETESTRLENGVLYRFDVTKVMFASGNVDERERMKSLDCTGETVVDMFAGIGYFTLPLAKFSGAEKVIACEKNPDSYAFLVGNIELNGLEGRVESILGDNRDLPEGNYADRVLMGYVQTTSSFLPKALRIVKHGGIIHYHDTFPVDCYMECIRNVFDGACPGRYEILGVREVKSFAPAISHYVADVRIS